MENLVPNFQNLVIKEKIFTIFQPQNYLQIFAILTYFEPCIKFSKLFGHPKIFYRHFKKNRKFQWSINNSKKIPLTLTFVFELQPYKKIDSVENWFCVKIPNNSLFHRKPPPKFEIKALFRLVMLYTDTKKKKTYIIVKSIHSSLRSESKINFGFIKIIITIIPTKKIVGNKIVYSKPLGRYTIKNTYENTEGNWRIDIMNKVHFMKNGIVGCVTNIVLFNQLVLDKDGLNISCHKTILKYKNKQKKKVLCKSEPQNKVWRYLAYKQFISWINAWTTIGKGNRIVIPSCVIYKIRQTYLEENYRSLFHVDLKTTDTRVFNKTVLKSVLNIRGLTIDTGECFSLESTVIEQPWNLYLQPISFKYNNII
ncbi:hypothetical protein AGLY_018222 [Aphis glycines]|uniref:P2X purinoreceptor 7 intracellular domain-containing protein n=1 Tax=Aphis glycines TaxID=307491 RepID=A0A6G0SSN2_APHGL|nr:hypothetical protein AGLY_018222 [Aphis glycines]